MLARSPRAIAEHPEILLRPKMGFRIDAVHVPLGCHATTHRRELAALHVGASKHKEALLARHVAATAHDQPRRAVAATNLQRRSC
eukprot:scaffold141_cov232-Pinguiococcus_pyrenoidosus.AAC.11